MPSSHLILSRPLLLLPPIPPSIKVFSNESTLHMRWPKYWSFSFSIIPSKEIPGLFSFRMDWLDLLAVQGTLKSLLQRHSSKASILRCSAFLLSRVQLFVTPRTAARLASLSFTISQSLLKFMSIESVMPSIHFILCHPLLFLPSIFPSIRGFSKKDNTTCNAAYFKILIRYWQEVELRRNQALVNKIHYHINCWKLLNSILQSMTFCGMQSKG